MLEIHTDKQTHDAANAKRHRNAQALEAARAEIKASRIAERRKQATEEKRLAAIKLHQERVAAAAAASAAHGDALVVFTDGACEPNPGLGGWGFVVYQHGHEIHAACGGERNTTNNRMEFSGILHALRWLGDKKGTLHTDSMYCLNALTVWHGKWARNGWRKGPKANAEPVKNAELIQLCLEAKRSGHDLKWVKGHAGIVGNERADRLAAKGRSMAKTWKGGVENFA